MITPNSTAISLTQSNFSRFCTYSHDEGIEIGYRLWGKYLPGVPVQELQNYNIPNLTSIQPPLPAADLAWFQVGLNDGNSN